MTLITEQAQDLISKSQFPEGETSWEDPNFPPEDQLPLPGLFDD